MASASTKKASSKVRIPATAAQAKALGTWLSSQRTTNSYGKAFIFFFRQYLLKTDHEKSALVRRYESSQKSFWCFFYHSDIQDLGWDQMSKIPKNASWYSETRGQGHEQSDLKYEMNGDSESEQELEETLNEKAKELR